MTADLSAMREGQRRRAAASGRKLLHSAVSLIAERGYEKTTAAEIGIRAGFSRSMVRARFGSKEALIDNLMQSEYEERLLEATDPGEDGLSRVLDLADRISELAQEDEQFLRAMFVLSFEATSARTALHDRVKVWLARLESALCADFAAGIEDGSVAPTVDAQAAGKEVLRAGAGLAFSWLALPDSTLTYEIENFRARIHALARGANR